MAKMSSMLGAGKWGPPNARAAREFFEFSERYTKAYFQARSQRLTISGGEVANQIVEMRDAHQPASFIRVSDGEGNLVPLAFDIEIGQELNEYCLRRISYIHFGVNNIISDDKSFFGNMIREAVRCADILGFPREAAIQRGFDVEDRDKDVRAIVGNRCSGILSGLPHLHAPSVSYSDAWFSRGLLPHYKGILYGQERIGLISSYIELSELLTNNFNIREVDFINVPTQAVFVPTVERKNTEHYPTEMTKIIEQIQPDFQGMIYLVAAGLLGKQYCTVVKDRGGIAIDIGSVAEIWLGITARGLAPEYISRWKLPTENSC